LGYLTLRQAMGGKIFCTWAAYLFLSLPATAYITVALPTIIQKKGEKQAVKLKPWLIAIAFTLFGLPFILL
jgi:steroid 5-alpha reductase family enzyme